MSDDSYESGDDFRPCVPARKKRQHHVTRGIRVQRSVIAESSIRIVESTNQAFQFGGGYICNLQHRTGAVFQCNVLKVFHLHYVEALKVIVCPSLYGGCIIPADRLYGHLKNHHSQDLKLGRDLLSQPQWQSIVDHILVSHNIDSAQSSDTLRRDLPLNISRRIPTVERSGVENKAVTAVFYQCAADDCFHWAIRADNAPRSDANIIRHYQDQRKRRCPKHKDLAASSLHYRCAMVQKIQVLTLNGAFSHFFELPTGWSPAPQNTDVHLPIPPSYTDLPDEPISELIHVASWMDELAWTNYVHSLGAEIDALQALVSLPSETACKNATGKDKYIEEGLLFVYRDCTHYLQNANDYLDAHHLQVRDIVGK